MGNNKVDADTVHASALPTATDAQVRLIREGARVGAKKIYRATLLSGFAAIAACVLLKLGQTVAAVELAIDSVMSLSTLGSLMSALFMLTLGCGILLSRQLNVMRLCVPLAQNADARAHADELCNRSPAAREVRNTAVESGRQLYVFDYRAMCKAVRRPVRVFGATRPTRTRA